MRLVIIESPYAGDVKRNEEYARACVRNSLLRGEAPIASHLLYTQPGVLDDLVPSERQHGIDAGLAWRRVAEASVVYTDLGISSGMRYGIKAAEEAGNSVEYRTLGVDKLPPLSPLAKRTEQDAAMSEGEAEWMRNKLSKATDIRLLVRGDMGPREIGKLIKLLEAQKLVLEDDDGE